MGIKRQIETDKGDTFLYPVYWYYCADHMCLQQKYKCEEFCPVVFLCDHSVLDHGWNNRGAWRRSSAFGVCNGVCIECSIIDVIRADNMQRSSEFSYPCLTLLTLYVKR